MKQLMGSEYVISRHRPPVPPGVEPELLYVYQEGRRAPLAGPWPNTVTGKQEAVSYLLELTIQRLGPGKKLLFEELYDRSGAETADYYQLLFLVGAVARGWTRARLLKYAGQLNFPESHRRYPAPRLEPPPPDQPWLGFAPAE